MQYIHVHTPEEVYWIKDFRHMQCHSHHKAKQSYTCYISYIWYIGKWKKDKLVSEIHLPGRPSYLTNPASWALHTERWFFIFPSRTNTVWHPAVLHLWAVNRNEITWILERYMQEVLGEVWIREQICFETYISIDTTFHLHTCILSSKLVVVCACKRLKHDVDIWCHRSIV